MSVYAFFVFSFNRLFMINYSTNPFPRSPTTGGYVLGWLGDAILIPEMVRDANNDPRFVDAFKEQLRRKARPPFQLSKFCSTFMVAYLWAQVSMIAIPDADYDATRDFSFLEAVVPFVVALAVWTVGNCGRQRGGIGPCLLAAYAAYPLRFFADTEKYWVYAVIVVSAVAFEYWSKQWLLTPPKRRNVVRRVAVLYACGALYLSMFGSYCYFNAKITTAEGDVVSVHESVAAALNSDWWTVAKASMGETWAQVQHRGYYESWKLVWDQIDTDGDARAFKVRKRILYMYEVRHLQRIHLADSRPGRVGHAAGNHRGLPPPLEGEPPGQGEGLGDGAPRGAGSFHGHLAGLREAEPDEVEASAAQSQIDAGSVRQ